MSFWQTSDNSALANNGTAEMGGGNIEPMPEGTQVLAAPEEAKWDEYGGDRYISIRWSVLAPEEYKNRKVFQKIRVMDADAKKADKAKRMLAAIDQNAQGGLMQAGTEPTDQSLMQGLVNKPMVLKLGLWKIEASQSNDGQERSGNWVQAVSPRNAQQAQAAPPPLPQQALQPDPAGDVPF